MRIRIIINNIIPFKGFKAITIWPWIFCRKALKDVYVNHEMIHVKQQVEMLVLPFFIWYVFEWIIRLIIYLDSNKAYYSISFEKEAYENQQDYNYNNVRKHYAWIKYIFKSK